MKTWKSAGNIATGRSHIKSGTQCQDKIMFFSDSRTDIISLADGAGSCKLSHIGADIAAKKICDILHQDFDTIYALYPPDAATNIASLLQNHLLIIADNNSATLSDLSSTLLFVALNNNRFIAGNIGDGVIGVLYNNGALSVLSHPSHGEHLNETFFITSPKASQHLEIYTGTLEEISGFVIMSDGTAESLYSRKDKFLSKVCNQILSWLDDNCAEDVRNALGNDLENIVKLRTTDDCSINLLKKVDMSFEELENHSNAFKKEFLRIDKGAIFFKNQLVILRSISKGAKSVKIIRENTGLSKTTIYRHIRNLQSKCFLNRNKSSFDVID